ncbi:MAG: hypothetical protein FP825_11720 [Hyphomonas sp.]|uniref:hypothetical protein n=1 Tax=Hyphomonas sp. TaxID=87 RepID=UPI001821B9AF|nr:hypothetical protein [Hyphomonas sp.]MBA3069137.1 hypothetical protein [Hyphomonas sp.]MBU4061552.1 hypothetical protein [Alphaproteobacteria bacterium]MBU4165410.1 hypothetical protein [Alphaproteobacteria bacterium]
MRSLRDEVVDVAALAVLRDGNWAPFNFEEVERAVDQSQMYVQAVEVIDDRLLTFPHGVGKVLYGEQTVLDYGGSLRNGIYYDGRIFVSHFDTPTMGAWLTYCDWQPPQSVCTNTKKQDWPYWNDVYGMIGWRGHVYLSAGADGSGKGSGVWRIDPESGEMLRVFPKAETFPGEFYGMLVVNDTLIAGHYPSGYLAVISSDGSARFLEVPKALGGSYGMAEGQVEYREAQSLNLYAGRVWVGMYPWGFLWEGDASLENWIRHRLFTWPEVDSGEPAPFHNELDRRYAAMTPEERAVKGAWALPSFWGQRIHSVALSGDENAVLYGLGNMPGLPYDPERDASFGTKEDFKDYGSVRGLRAPNTLIKYIPWPKNGVLDLDFAVSGNRMTLSFEGKTLETVEAHLDVFDLARMKLRSVGSGLYGRSAYEVEAVD